MSPLSCIYSLAALSTLLAAMVDPHTAAAGTGTLVTVMVFIGSQLSPSVMIHRAVKKELKAGALLKKHGADIEPEAWERLNELEEK